MEEDDPHAHFSNKAEHGWTDQNVQQVHSHIASQKNESESIKIRVSRPVTDDAPCAVQPVTRRQAKEGMGPAQAPAEVNRPTLPPQQGGGTQKLQ
jgi:hypothetical protein